MAARDSGESYRGVSPLELLVDLCFVGAVAQAASQLRNAAIGGTALTGGDGYGPRTPRKPVRWGHDRSTAALAVTLTDAG